MTRGRWFVVLAFVVALAAALGNLAYQHQRFGPAHDFWGGPMALAIGQDEHVELLLVEPAEESTPASETLVVGALRLRISERREISHAEGLSQLRRSLLDRHTFDWSAHPPAGAIAWRYALRFGKDDAKTLAISDDGQWIAAPRSTVSSAPRAKALVEFCAHAIAAPTP